MTPQQTNSDPKKNAPLKETTSQQIEAAHEQAEKDIDQDADLSIHSPNDDLDEAESARLGDSKEDVVL